METGVPAVDDLAQAREAYRRHEFQRALELWDTRARTVGALPAEDQHQRALTLWLTGTASQVFDPLERAFEAFMADGDPARAAIVALDLVHFHADALNPGLAEAWMKRAVDLIQGQPESAAHGWVALFQAFMARMGGHLDLALDRAGAALDMGRRTGDRDLEAMALNNRGRTLIRLGRVAEGRRFLDEAMVGVVAGELSGGVTGAVYCSTIDGCTDVSDYARASEWTDAARRWCARKAISGFPGICRVHQAEIERLRGHWDRAEGDARQAIKELEARTMLHVAGAAYSELGTISCCKGDLESSEQAFRQTISFGRDPQPGQALLRLAQGKTAAAASAIRRALDDETQPLARIRMLPAAVRILIAAGARVDEVEPLVQEIEDTAERFDSASFRACALDARGSLWVAIGNSREGAAKLREAIKSWTSLDVPYAAAQTRMLLAEAYRGEGDEEAAIAAADAACAAFERLGARLDCSRARAFLHKAEGAPETTPAQNTRQDVTFMFTDIVGSTSLLEAIGDDAWSALLRWHDETLRAAFASHHGEEIKHTGDGFHVAFVAPHAALACGVEIQRKLDQQRREQGFAPQVRIGVHSTTATRTGKDFAGMGVHEAARIAGLATAGEILTSVSTAQAAGNDFARGEAREASLKGKSQAVSVVPIRWRRAGQADSV